MVFRLIGLIGLTLLPLTATAGEPTAHRALSGWLADGGVGDTRYQPVTVIGSPEAPPSWLLHPKGADALNRQLLDRGIYPEAIGLDWRKGVGALLVFGAPHSGDGFRLLVDRDRQRPVELETTEGIRWRFLDFESRSGRRTDLPGRIVRQGVNGGRTAYLLSR